MAIIDVDFPAAQDAPQDVKLPVGAKLIAEITRTNFTHSKANGNSMVVWEFTVTDPGHPEFQGKKVPFFSSLMDNMQQADGTPDLIAKAKASARFMEFLDRCNIPYDPKATQFDTDSALGKTALVEIDYYEGNPKVANVIKL